MLAALAESGMQALEAAVAAAFTGSAGRLVVTIGAIEGFLFFV